MSEEYQWALISTNNQDFQHVVVMLYDVTDVICSRIFYDFLSSPMINVVTILSNVTDVIDHF